MAKTRLTRESCLRPPRRWRPCPSSASSRSTAMPRRVVTTIRATPTPRAPRQPRARGDRPCGDDRRRGARGRRAERSRRAPLPAAALPYQPGRLREYTLTATDVELEVAPGVFFPAWVYNGTAPGPVIRATEGDRLRVNFVNAGSHPHTIHFHGIHPTNMDGVFEIVEPGGRFRTSSRRSRRASTSTTATRPR